MLRDRLLQRFLSYVAIETTANDATLAYPSSPGQLVLGRQLAVELAALGLTDARQDEHGVVTATLPATVAHATPVVALNAHLDTSPETSGKDIRPQIIHDYAGGDIVLPGDPRQVIRVDENPELRDLVGRTLITTDGTTLLGADDKAGVAVIMELAAHLVKHPEIPHGPVRVLFTCDEEIGRGVAHVDPRQLGADVAYTLDGAGAGVVDAETFSADLATLTVRGRNIHPSIAKGRMVNAVRAAAAFVARLPHDRLSPETTAERQGFLHPYLVSGGVGEVVLKVLLRDFATPQLELYAQQLRATAEDVVRDFPGLQIDVQITSQYRNMAEGLTREPRAVTLALAAHRRLGREPRQEVIRGGTDGSQLTALGLPTPNLSTGEHNPHSPLEWTCLEEMEYAVQHLIELLTLWGAEAIPQPRQDTRTS